MYLSDKCISKSRDSQNIRCESKKYKVKNVQEI